MDNYTQDRPQGQVFYLWSDLRNQVYLGNEEFIEKIHKSKT